MVRTDETLTMNKKLSAFVLSFFCLFSTVTAQNENLRKIHQQFTNSLNERPQEKLFVHTDKDFYLVGEIIWFKIYQDTKTSISSVAYIDVIDANSKSILAVKISLKKLEDNGSTLIPLSVSSGNYRLRAYTNWMKNAAEEIFFEKEITIINPFKNPGSESLKRTEGYDVNFFPEGGNLVKGLESKIAFKITDKYGQGVEGKGKILNEKNEPVATFTTYKFGMGNFTFTPTEKNYKASIQVKGSSDIVIPFVVIRDNGYAMTVNNKGNVVEVLVKSTYSEPQNLNLICRNSNALLYSSSSIMANGRVLFTFKKDSLHNGVNQFTIFNQLNQPVCERLFFIKPENNSFITTTLNKELLSTREKVDISVATRTATGDFIDANLSAAVYRLDSFHTWNQKDIVSYFWLASDIKGYIETPSYYFLTDNEEARIAADNLMLTQGWRRYNWNEVLSNSSRKYSYLPERSGHIITAILKDKISGQPIADKEIFFSIPGSPFIFLTAITDAQGVAKFNVKELYGQGKLILQVNSPNADLYKIEMLNPFFNETSNTSAIPFHLNAHQSLLEQYSINMQVQNIYSADSMRIFYAHEIKDSLPFYGTAKYKYKLDSYTRFTTMEEVLREYVRELNVGSRNGKLFLKIADEPRREFNEEDLLVLWDGVPLKNPHSIYQFDPLKVKQLEVIPQRFAAGGSFFNGIASFTTYSADRAGFSPPQAFITDYDGLQLQREFYSPSYQTEAQIGNRMPDFRNTLYWSPNVHVNAKGEGNITFYTGDRKGNYVVVLQGLDENGNPMSTTQSFLVK